MFSRIMLLPGMHKRLVLIGAITVAMMVVPALGEHQGATTLKRAVDASSIASADKEMLYRQVRKKVRELDYSENVARDFVEMVDSWKDTQGRSVLAVLKTILTDSKESCMKGKISKNQLANIEMNVVNQLGQIIKQQIGYKRDFFELADITSSQKANCCGYAQLLCILGNSIGLSVSAIRVIEPVEGPMATVPRHTANTAKLSDETTIIVDLTRKSDSCPESALTVRKYQNDTEPSEGNGQDAPSGSGWTNRPSKKQTVVEACFIEQLAVQWEDSETDNREIQTLDRSELIAELNFSRGTVYYALGRNAEAIEAYSMAIKANPKCVRAYNNRGSVYLTDDMYKEAISNFNKAIQLNPEFAHAYHNRASSRFALGLYSETISDYTRAIELGLEFEHTFLKRGFAYLKSERYAQAVADYTRAIELNPKSGWAYYRRGTAYALLKDRGKARKDLFIAIKLNPTLKPQVEQISNQLELKPTVG